LSFQHKEHGGDGEPPGEGWVAIENVPEDAVVKEMNERKITTHDEVEDVLETEEVRHLGDVSSEVRDRWWNWKNTFSGNSLRGGEHW